VTKDGVGFVMYANGAWTEAKTISTGTLVTTDGAVNALERMVSGQQ